MSLTHKVTDVWLVGGGSQLYRWSMSAAAITADVRTRTVVIHNVCTIPLDSNTMVSLQELAESPEPGHIRVINGATIFLTDTELDASEAATLGPDDFADLTTWREYLQARVAEGKV